MVVGGLAFAAGAVCWQVLWRWKDRNLARLKALEAEGQAVKARADAEKIVQEAKISANQEAMKLRHQMEQSFAAQRAEQVELERRLSEREGLINSQLRRIMESEKRLTEQSESLRVRSEGIEAGDKKLADLNRQISEQLQKISGLSAAEARGEFLKRIEQESLGQAAGLSRQILDDAKNRAEEKARAIIGLAIQRYAGDHTFENTTATVALQGDEIKGRIIGREGRNIRAFEAATGVTVLIDDTPGAVLLSGFDPVRREIARESMVRLIADGRIHPTRIEEVVTKVSQEMDETIVRLGEEAVQRAGLPPMHPEIVKPLGRLHFRHSYSQNILNHSVEVAQLCGLMAAELGVDVSLAKRAGLLHDIGKALSHEIEGPHAVSGAELIKRYGEPETVVNAVASHHNDVTPIGPLGLLVSAADAISASRPGARSESMTTYLKRIEDLERIATSFQGVDKCFAVQAGRELRVFVQPDQISDEKAYSLARDIALKIESELAYPGQIKITVIREKRCVEVAK